ncbi:MAG: ABC transporter substrate-binding protein [Lachnospiraceae bacterium]|nr:ABC transporter substrate-binding protein [Lachnospiraceae bacterium]
MHKRLLIILISSLIIMGLPGFSECGSPSLSLNEENSVILDKDEEKEGNAGEKRDVPESAKVSSELVFEKEMQREYAEKFRVFYYEGGYTLLEISETEERFLLVPEDGKIPSDLSEDVKVIKRPVKNIYLVASAVMDMFASLDGVDSIKFSGKKEEDWYIPDAVSAMKEGNLIYAGKYSKPDYEMIVSGECSVIIENTMIYHSPEVKEQFESFKIPVIVEYSNYEDHPLGRVEWIKFFGALLGQEEMADKVFYEQKAIVDSVADNEKTNKTVAYFYITSNNLIQVRKSSDHISKMIEIAGGEYIFKNLEDDDSKRTTVNMQIEEFYNEAKDADILIYNSSIDGGVNSLPELYAKCEHIKDFKAAKEGNVWCTTNDSYQQSLSAGYMIEDLNNILNGEYDNLHYLFRLEENQ